MSLDGNPLNGSVPLDSSSLFPYRPGTPPNATQTSHFKVNQTAALDWELDGVTFSSEGTGFVPLLFDPRPLPGVIGLTTGAVIDIVLQVSFLPFWGSDKMLITCQTQGGGGNPRHNGSSDPPPRPLLLGPREYVKVNLSAEHDDRTSTGSAYTA